MSGLLLVGILAAAALPPSLQAQETELRRTGDWPQFRGPGGNGSSTESGFPVEWSKDRGVRWKVELPGRGLSSPVIAGGRLYLTACTGPEEERLHVLCFDARTGRRLWERQFWATGPTQCNRKTCMAAPTIAADGARVFALFATGDVAALDREGTLLWYRSLCGDYPTIGNNVGMAASPVLHQNTLFVAMENVGDSFVAGLDAGTGRNRWKLSRAQKINWTTPLVVEGGGRAQVLFQSPEELTAHDPETGTRLWRVEGKLATIPSPVAADGAVFAPGGTSLALRPGATDVSRLWESDKLPSATASPTFYKGRLYTVNSAGVVTCADPKDASVLWRARAAGPHSASPVFAEDRLYLVSEKGTTTVLQLGDEPKTLAENVLEDVFIASPALSGGAIYLRSDRALYCLGK
jgi:outer membrane protein assembly factor BamB